MGNELSSTPILPLSFGDCFVNGQLDIKKYQLYLLVRRKREENIEKPINSSECSKVNEDERPHKKRKCRSVKKHRIEITQPDGTVTYMEPKNSLWYLLYIIMEPQSNRQRTKFRQRFRLSYDSFKKILHDIKANEAFERWSKKDAVGNPPVPIELLLLGFFRYVGRGFTFDDLEECTAISAETHRQFMLSIIQYGSSVLWNKYVIKTDNIDDAHYNSSLYKSAGFPGCVGSVDGTHVMLESCADWAQNKHKGYKLNKPSRNYNVACNHKREFLGCTRGFPATWNDKTTVLYDHFTRGIYNGEILSDYEFELNEYDQNGNIITVQYQGAWLICDNGYLNWSTTIPPFKQTDSFGHLLFSEWIESMQKDIECAFGILKGRFRILKYGMRFRKVEHCDMLFKTLCAVHNFLIKEDGLDVNWMNFEDAHQEDLIVRNKYPSMLLRLHNLYVENRSSSTSPTYTSPPFKEKLERKKASFTLNNKRVVRLMPQSLFIECLVEHFNICYNKGLVVWPRMR